MVLKQTGNPIIFVFLVLEILYFTRIRLFRMHLSVEIRPSSQAADEAYGDTPQRQVAPAKRHRACTPTASSPHPYRTQRIGGFLACQTRGAAGYAPAGRRDPPRARLEENYPTHCLSARMTSTAVSERNPAAAAEGLDSLLVEFPAAGHQEMRLVARRQISPRSAT